MLKDYTSRPGLPNIDPDEVDGRLADGWSLPATLYHDAAVAELEDELIWRPAWQVVGTLADFRKAGDYVSALVGKYPVVVVRDKNGELKAFLNVCRHRGALVVGGKDGNAPDGNGNCQRFQCIYHSWTYGLDGGLMGAPNFKEGNLPPFEELGLHPISVDVWGGAVFISIEPTTSLAATFSEAQDLMADKGFGTQMEDEGLKFAGAFEWKVAANWKTFQEVNVECYHCGTVHSDSLATVMNVDFGRVDVVNARNVSHLSGPYVEDLEKRLGPDAAARLRRRAADAGEHPFSQAWLFPSNVVSHGTGWGVGIYRIDALDANTCRMIARIYSNSDDTTDSDRVLEFLPNVVVEDVAVTSGVQIGLRSGAREWGPLVGSPEKGVPWFSQQVWNALAPGFRDASQQAND
jgi:phenylpropionate dioxygenase-like ring-hydroxylating dioxygenase large terminal subunit